MDFDAVQQLWISQSEGGSNMPDEKVIQAVMTTERQLERRVRIRDYVELATAVGMAAIFLGVAFVAPVAWPWVAAASIVLGVGAVFARERRRGARAQPAGQLRESLHQALTETEHQIRLLRSVLWWYLAPLIVVAALVLIGTFLGIRSDLEPEVWDRVAANLWAPLLGVMLAVAGVFAFVWWLNQNAVRRHLQPHRDNLAVLVEQIDGASAEEMS